MDTIREIFCNHKLTTPQEVGMQDFENFQLKFTSKQVTAWRGLALLKKMLDAIELGVAMTHWQLPQPGSNRGYALEQNSAKPSPWNAKPCAACATKWASPT